MRKSILSLVSIMALSGLSYAGGSIAPVIDEPIVVPELVASNSAFYVGLGFGQSTINDDTTSEEFSSTNFMIQAGYQYNQYIAIEGRYGFGFDTDYDQGNTNGMTDYDGDIENWGIYLKPMYPITEEFDIYALLGYGGVALTDIAGGDAYESGFQWGLGAQYAVTESISVFADYVKLYDDTGLDYRALLDDIDSDTWTIGVSYKF